MLKKIFGHRIFWMVIGFILLTLFIWFAGPLFAFADWRPLAPISHRLWFLGIVLAILLLPPLVRFILGHMATRRLVEAMKQQATPDPNAAKHNPEVLAMTERFLQAISALKKRPGQKSLYQIPWYIVIGPPGTGKTTAIQNSGLTFPADSVHHQDAMQGIGGTRNCQWWFTREAILIDTAGRYFSQDSDQQTDTAEWTQFLHLLRKHRRRRPINGALITLSLTELVGASREQRLRHAQTIKSRLQELNRELKVRVPIYFLLTKTDTLPGFNEFFAQLRSDERQQVWGFTLPAVVESDQLSSRLSQEFSLLLERLNSQVLERVHYEKDSSRRQRIIDFPKQLALHQGGIVSLLKDLFADQQLMTAAQFRGLYLTSGTQDGTLLDRLMTDLSSQQPTQNISDLWEQPTEGKSYFIHHVFTQIIFQETGLVGSNPRLERYLRWAKRSAYGASAAVGVMFAVLLTASYNKETEFLGSGQQMMTKLETQLSNLVNTPELSVESRIQLLNLVNQLPGDYPGGYPQGVWAPLMTMGLSQYPKLERYSDDLYRSLNTHLLMPILRDYLVAVMGNLSLDNNYHYQALKAYLMLNDSERYDANTIYALLELDWLPRLQLPQDKQQYLANHLGHLLKEYRPGSQYAEPDEALIADVRHRLRDKPMAVALYGNLKTILSEHPTLKALPGFSLYEAAGGIGADRLFKRSSALDLRKGIDSLFTKPGYIFWQQQLSGELNHLFEEYQWVLLGESQQSITAEEVAILTDRVQSLYVEEYIQHYKTLLADVTLVPFGSAEESSRLLTLLSHPTSSPLAMLIKQTSTQTQIQAPLPKGAGKALGQMNAAKSRVQSFLGIAQTPNNRPVSGEPVTDFFSSLHQLSQEESGTINTQQALGLLQKLQQYIQTVALETSSGAPLSPHLSAQGKTLVQEIRLEAQNYPQVVKGVLLSASQQVSAMAHNGILSHLNQSWRGQAYPFCQQAIAGRYPLRANSLKNAKLDDFGRFFGYGGVMESFFNEQLLDYVNIASKPWSNKRSGQGSVALSTQGLANFELADQIKRAFFPYNSAKPSIRFALTPGNLSKEIAQATLTLDGQRLDYQHGRQIPMTLSWPGPSPQKQARLDVTLFDGRLLSLQEPGDWGWFRLMNQAKMKKPRGGEHYQMTFSIQGHTVVYQLEAYSAFNPFNLRILSQFQCQQVL